MEIVSAHAARPAAVPDADAAEASGTSVLRAEVTPRRQEEEDAGVLDRQEHEGAPGGGAGVPAGGGASAANAPMPTSGGGEDTGHFRDEVRSTLSLIQVLRPLDSSVLSVRAP
jgi:hypothetical protein